jgi:hypothetical protein
MLASRVTTTALTRSVGSDGRGGRLPTDSVSVTRAAAPQSSSVRHQSCHRLMEIRADYLKKATIELAYLTILEWSLDLNRF